MNRLISWSLLGLLSTTGLNACGSVVKVNEQQLIEVQTQQIPDDWQVSADPVRAEAFADLYNDEILTRFLQEAVEKNYDLEQARLRIRRADAQLKQVDARRSLSVDSSGGVGLSGDFDDLNDSGNAGLFARFDPDLFGELKSAVKGAEARSQIARAEKARLQRTLLSNVISAYVRSIEASLLLSVAEQNLEFLEETERVTRARFEGGDAAGSDLALSQLELATARASLAEQRFAAEDTRRALSILIGGFGDSELSGLPSIPSTLPSVSAAGIGLSGSPSVVLTKRYDVQAIRLGVIESAAALEGVRAADLPGASLSASFSGNRPLSDIFDIDEYITSLAASLTYNLLDGGLNDAQQRDAEAVLDTALSNYAETLRRTMGEIRTSVSQVDTLRNSLAALKAAETAAERALELEGIRFDLGEAILLDVLTVQRRVDATRSARLRTQRRYLEAVAQAHLALGPS
jgi:multidrug efflux system outer membrane protein